MFDQPYGRRSLPWSDIPTSRKILRVGGVAASCVAIVALFATFYAVQQQQIYSIAEPVMVVAAVVAAILLGAHQWQEKRQKEQLKRDMVERIARDAGEAASH